MPFSHPDQTTSSSPSTPPSGREALGNWATVFGGRVGNAGLVGASIWTVGWATKTIGGWFASGAAVDTGVAITRFIGGKLFAVGTAIVDGGTFAYGVATDNRQATAQALAGIEGGAAGAGTGAVGGAIYGGVAGACAGGVGAAPGAAAGAVSGATWGYFVGSASGHGLYVVNKAYRIHCGQDADAVLHARDATVATVKGWGHDIASLGTSAYDATLGHLFGSLSPAPTPAKAMATAAHNTPRKA